MNEKVRKVINERLDKHKLRGKTEFVVDCSEKFLIPYVENVSVHDYSIAKVSPEIKIMIVPGMEPAYFFDYKGGRAYWAKHVEHNHNLFFIIILNETRR